MTENEAKVKVPTTEPARARGSLGGGALLTVGLLAAFFAGRCSVTTEPEDPVVTTVSEDAASDYVCPMHPQIRQEAFGKCPICGMDLAKEAVAPASNEAETITLGPRARALAGLQVSPVARSKGARELHLLGTVVPDERRLRSVTAWTGGRIETLVARTTGERVRRGQVIAELYSPELYAATRDFLVAYERQAGASGDAGSWLDGPLKAARARLQLLGMRDAAIEQIASSGQAPRLVKVRSQFSGTVIDRKVETGTYVQAGEPLLGLADLSRVWVEVEAFESDLPALAVGQEVTVTPSATGGAPFRGEVTFIDPVLDMSARTAKVRVEVENTDGALRPGMFVHARIEATTAADVGALSVPASAVLWTGRRSVVFVEVPGADVPAYQLREVVVGPRAGAVYPVLSGVSEGERIVTRGAFVLDADLQLRGHHSMMDIAVEDAVDDVGALVVTDATLASLVPVVAAYLDTQGLLAADDLDAGRASLGTLAEAVSAVNVEGPAATRKAWADSASTLVGHARTAQRSKDDPALRVAFEHVSDDLRVVLTRFGNPLETPVEAAYCPMAFDNRGAGWFQRPGVIANPYYGAAMLRCGDVRATLATGERLGERVRTPSGDAAPATKERQDG